MHLLPRSLTIRCVRGDGITHAIPSSSPPGGDSRPCPRRGRRPSTTAALNEQGRLLTEEILAAAAGCPVEAIRVATAP
jgi:hypothetical protein